MNPDLPKVRRNLSKVEYQETLEIPEDNSTFCVKEGILTLSFWGRIHVNTTGSNGSGDM